MNASPPHSQPKGTAAWLNDALVDRLRNPNFAKSPTFAESYMREAADRIEELENWNRLRAEDIINLGQQAGRLEAALREIAKEVYTDGKPTKTARTARAALPQSSGGAER